MGKSTKNACRDGGAKTPSSPSVISWFLNDPMVKDLMADIKSLIHMIRVVMLVTIVLIISMCVVNVAFVVCLAFCHCRMGSQAS